MQSKVSAWKSTDSPEAIVLTFRQLTGLASAIEKSEQPADISLATMLQNPLYDATRFVIRSAACVVVPAYILSCLVQTMTQEPATAVQEI